MNSTTVDPEGGSGQPDRRDPSSPDSAAETILSGYCLTACMVFTGKGLRGERSKNRFHVVTGQSACAQHKCHKMIQTDDIVAELMPVFLDDVREKLVRLTELLEKLPQATSGAEEWLEVLRLVHSIKGAAGGFGFPSLTIFCHRFEDYLHQVTHISPRVMQDFEFFLAQLSRIVERGQDPGEQKARAIFDTLPTPPSFDAVTSLPLSALFIGQKDVQLRMMEAELRGCGIRLSRAFSSFQGLELAVRTRPDFVMVSSIVDVLDGAEIIWMLRSVRRIRTMPLFLLVADGGDDRTRRRLMDELPPDISVVRKYPHFPSDFADALTRLNILQ